MTLTGHNSAGNDGAAPGTGSVSARARPGSQVSKGSAAQSNRHIKALDGLRGIAVLLVLLFHFELGPFHGGFVGVTVFFTLSGFLICSRTLTEVGRSGTFRVIDFFERRVRRLAPAAIVCILAVVVATNLFGTREQHASVAGDGIAALFNVANWRFLVHGTSYTDLFAAPSPLNHFWSLAIEEQFYVVFPVVVWLVLQLPRRVRAMVVAAVVSLALWWSAHESSVADSFNRFYYGTDARMGELLVGVIIALSLAYWHIRVPQPQGPRRRAITVLMAGGLAYVIFAGVTFQNGAANFQHGGALFVALATGVLIVGGLEGQNPVARALAIRPLVWVGKVSYGAYLYHWPIVALSGKHWGPLHGTALGLTQLAVSLGLAGVSFRYLEAPIQRRRFAGSRRVLLTRWSEALAGVTAVALGLMLFNAPASTPAYASSTASTGQTTDAPVPVPPKTNTVNRPMRVLVTGDSTGTVMAKALKVYQAQHPDKILVLDLSLEGCPITPVDDIRNYAGEKGQNVSLCGGWQKTFPAQVKAFEPDVSVVFLSVMEQTDQLVAGGWRNLLDPDYRTYQLKAWNQLISVLTSTGAPVEWADAPYFTFNRTDLPWVSDDPERTDELNAMFRELVAGHPDVKLLDYASHLNKPGHVDDFSVRPDGVHMSKDLDFNPNQAAVDLAENWLIPTLKPFTPAAQAGQNPPASEAPPPTSSG